MPDSDYNDDAFENEDDAFEKVLQDELDEGAHAVHALEPATGA